MIYLLTKIFFLLLVAALLGAWFMRWWLWRNYSDVTGEYLTLSNSWNTWRKNVEDLLARRPEPNFAPILTRLTTLEQAVGKIPAPPTVDLTPILGRIAEVDQAVRAIQIPAPPSLDLTSVHQRIDGLEQAVGAIKIPVPEMVDFTGLYARLAEVESSIRDIRIPAPAPPADLTETLQRLEALERAVRAIVIPPATIVDLSPVMQKLNEMSLPAAAASAAAPPPAPPPAAPPVAPSMTPPETPATIIREGSRNLLAHAAYGAPDNLQLIKGVAGVLEKMLHDIGVYYFWQIAEWTPADIVHADAQLTAFHGRITRDDWVKQATILAAHPEAKNRPEDL